MEQRADDVLTELKNLRKGFGVEDPGATARIGGALRRIAGIVEDDAPAEQMAKVKACLNELVGALPEPAARACTVALGLEGPAGLRLNKRLELLATELGRDPRTIRRRADAALARIARDALAMSGSPPPRRNTPWHLMSLKVLVRLDTANIEVTEHRRIVSHRPDLEEVEFSVTVLDPPRGGRTGLDDLQITVLEGGALSTRERLSSTRLGFSVRLPRPMGQGEAHGLSFRVRLGGELAPLYVCTPRYACRRFDLTVRFSMDRLPARVWRIDNELPLEAHDPSLARSLTAPDSVGEVRATFRQLETNRSYGLGWDIGAA